MANTPVKDLIDKWSTRRELADAVGANLAAVHKWAAADRIPTQWQAHVVRAAQARGMHEITGDWMVAHHQRERGAA